MIQSNCDAAAEWNHYALFDPRIKDEFLRIRYVGRTKKSLERRYSGHKQAARLGITSHQACWMRKMLAAGVEPGIVNLGRGGSDRESELIAYYRNAGADLTNGTAGGDGVVDPTPEVRAKISASNKLRCSQASVREKASALARSQWADPLFREKQRAGMYSPEACAKRNELLSDRTFIEKRAVAAKQGMARPEAKAKARATRATPESQAKRSAAARLAGANPEKKAKHAEAARKCWRDPEWVKKRSATTSCPAFRAAAGAKISATKKASVTHCKQGHLLCGDNIYESQLKRGARVCKLCSRSRAKEHKRKMKKARSQ